MSFIKKVVSSWRMEEGNVSSQQEIRQWIKDLNTNVRMNVEKISMYPNATWFYDKDAGCIRNRNNSFFTINGYQLYDDDGIYTEQPIIVQDEIGYLGIICKEIDGVLNFLMQAKIEPGNVNKNQISPTIQATKSNFMQKHGGNLPLYFDYFYHSDRYHVVVDQIQSEQAGRFLRKRNRNIIIELNPDDEIEVSPMHKWMTLGQIKALMKEDNLINMDARTVLSCIPFEFDEVDAVEREEISQIFLDKPLFYSMCRQPWSEQIYSIYQYLNSFKMFQAKKGRLVPLDQLAEWEISENGLVCRHPYDFKVIYCKVEIEGREVQSWEQPLVEALGEAVFGLYTCVDNGIRQFLVQGRPEIGCYDSIELGPTVHLEPISHANSRNHIDNMFLEQIKAEKGIHINAIFSEEGGRFYHEQNRNVILETTKDAVGALPDGYFWMDFATLEFFLRINNCLNIQLRNLISLLEI